jgi:phospholipid/cholesterol/gamma-HCH transport system substrate-binding protein
VNRVRETFEDRPARIGLAAVIGCVAFVAVAVNHGVPLPFANSDRIVHAVFASTNELRKGDPVRVGGIAVGKVAAIKLQPGTRTADVDLRIEDRDVELRADARAATRWTTLLGGSLFVDLDPGSPSLPPAGGNTIPVQRTSSQVEFDQVTQTLEGDGRQRVRDIAHEMRGALQDPAAVGRAIDVLASSAMTLRRGVRPLLGEMPDDLQQLIKSTSRTVSGLGRDDRALRLLVSAAAATTRVTALRRQALGALLEQTPAALDATRITATRIERTLDVLDPVAQALRPGARALEPAGRRLQPTLRRAATLLQSAKPLLEELLPALSATGRAAREGLPVLDALAPTLTRARDELLPFLERRDPDTGQRLIDMIGPTAAGAGNAATEFDASGNILHFGVLGDERTGAPVPCQTFFTDPTVEEKVRCDALNEVLTSIFAPKPRRRP